MKLPDPSLGSYSLRAGAEFFAFTQCLSAFYILTKYIETRLIQAEEMCGVHIVLTWTTLFTFLGLIFNFIVHFILFRGIDNKRARNVWLIFRVPGIIFWIWSVYGMSPCGSQSANRSLSKNDSCFALGVAGTIYECYVWYVILAYTMSIGWNNGANGEVNGNPLPPLGPSSEIPGLDGRTTAEVERDIQILREKTRRVERQAVEIELYVKKQTLEAENRRLEQEFQVSLALHRERVVNNANARQSHLNNNGESNPNSENGVLTCDPPPDYNDIRVPPPNPGNSDEIPGLSHADRSYLKFLDSLRD